MNKVPLLDFRISLIQLGLKAVPVLGTGFLDRLPDKEERYSDDARISNQYFDDLAFFHQAKKRQAGPGAHGHVHGDFLHEFPVVALDLMLLMDRPEHNPE